MYPKYVEDGLVNAVDEEIEKPQTLRDKALFIRKVSQSSDLEKTLLKALKVFKLFNIPHYICGGFAVQEHGYPRFTQDIDIIVPNVTIAREKLSLNGFKANPGSAMTVTDRETKVEIDLLQAGSAMGGSSVSFPKPQKVSDQPQILSLDKLLSLKLATYQRSPVSRAKDYGDAVELIKANKPPKHLSVHPSIKKLFQETWEQLKGVGDL